MINQLNPLIDGVVGGYRMLNQASAGLLTSWDQFVIHCTGYDLIPPMWLRYRIQGTPDINTYIQAGKLSRESIERVLDLQGRTLTDCPRILDFGCGCGRTLRWFRDVAGQVELHGTDIDSESIEWCRSHYEYVNFQVNRLSPPLPYADNTFDLIYALSVFTHLTEQSQFDWIRELTRVVKPGGLLFLTFLGYAPEKVRAQNQQRVPRLFGKRILGFASMDMWDFLSIQEIQQLREAGFVFVPYGIGPLGKEYGITYHRREYIEQRYSETIRLRDYIPNGFAGYLDVGLFQK